MNGAVSTTNRSLKEAQALYSACGYREIKRMWVKGSVRSLGLGRRIVETLEEQAREYAVHVLRLDTNCTLKEARALYPACGYRETAPFNDELYAHFWFEKNLVVQHQKTSTS